MVTFQLPCPVPQNLCTNVCKFPCFVTAHAPSSPTAMPALTMERPHLYRNTRPFQTASVALWLTSGAVPIWGGFSLASTSSIPRRSDQSMVGSERLKFWMEKKKHAPEGFFVFKRKPNHVSLQEMRFQKTNGTSKREGLNCSRVI